MLKKVPSLPLLSCELSVSVKESPDRKKKKKKKISYDNILISGFWVELFVKPSEINEKSFKGQRDKCVPIRKKSIKQYFFNITSNGILTNGEFWNKHEIHA